MAVLSKIKLDDNFNNEKTFRQISFVSDLVKDSGSIGDVYSLVQELEHQVQKKNEALGEYKEKYQDLLFQLRLKCFPLLSDTEIQQMLKKRILKIYQNDIDLKKLAAWKFVPFFGHSDFNGLSVMLKGIEDNTELIGSESIKLADGKIVAPVIGNWVKDYKAQMIEDRGTLNIVTYLTKNDNSKKLKPHEIDILKYLLSFYDWLRFKASKTSFIDEEELNLGGNKTEAEIQTTPKSSPALSTPLKSSFDQKLAQVSVSAPAHGEDLQALKQKIAQNKVSLAPKPTVPPAPSVKMTPQEIKREISTPELTGSVSEPSYITRSIPDPLPAPPKPVRPVSTPGPMSLKTLNDIKIIDDLKRVEIGHLRQGPISAQLELIKTKIITLARANNVLPYYTVIVFEQSALFKSYLQIGGQMIRDDAADRREAFQKALAGSSSDMTLQEFENIADLRKEIERL